MAIDDLTVTFLSNTGDYMAVVRIRKVNIESDNGTLKFHVVLVDNKGNDFNTYEKDMPSVHTYVMNVVNKYDKNCPQFTYGKYEVESLWQDALLFPEVEDSEDVK